MAILFNVLYCAERVLCKYIQQQPNNEIAMWCGSMSI